MKILDQIRTILSFIIAPNSIRDWIMKGAEIVEHQEREEKAKELAKSIPKQEPVDLDITLDLDIPKEEGER